MALGTFSKFFFGYEITLQNCAIDFSEGGPDLLAELTLGIYAPENLAVEIKTQLDAAGAKVYTVTFNRITRRFTIACDSGTFELLIGTGVSISISPWDLIGFTGVSDLTGFGTYTGDSASGQEYKPQFWLQDYTAPEQWLEYIDPAINLSASGYVEVINFGQTRFTEFNMLFITDKPMDGKIIKNNQNGVSDAGDFLEFAIKRGNMDFMPNESDPNTFYTIQLETTEASSKGAAYRLKEETGKNLPEFYQTGKLKWRVVG